MFEMKSLSKSFRSLKQNSLIPTGWMSLSSSSKFFLTSLQLVVSLLLKLFCSSGLDYMVRKLSINHRAHDFGEMGSFEMK